MPRPLRAGEYKIRPYMFFEDTMINEIAEKLSTRADLSAWQIRRVNSRSTQLYLIGHDTESRREVHTGRYVVTVYTEREEGGKKVMGESEFLQHIRPL